MSALYAVVNPATGETLKTYDTITDDALRDAIGRAHAAHEPLTSWAPETSFRSPSGGDE